MSDDEDILYIKRQKTIHYGALDEIEKEKLAAAAASGIDGAELVEDNLEEDGKAPPKLEVGNLHTSDGM